MEDGREGVIRLDKENGIGLRTIQEHADAVAIVSR